MAKNRTGVYTGFGGWGGGPGKNGGWVVFSLEKSKIARFYKLENFLKMLKMNEKFIIFENFKEIFAKI